MELALDMQNLRAVFRRGRQAVPILHGIDLQVSRGEVVGLIGESGSGKTMTGLAALRLLPPGIELTARRLALLDQDLLAVRPRRLRTLRGRRMAMVFQDPVGSFNPAKTIGWHLALAVRRAGTAAAPDVLARLLVQVGITDAPRVLRSHPHELSGGMLQRALIAMILACGPDLIVADEPTTNLDAMVERQIVELFRSMLQNLRAAMLYITHDIRVAALICDRIAVMYAGQVVEQGPARVVLEAPRHPYTTGLLRAATALDDPGRRLHEISGDLPPLTRLPPGCLFQPRCPVAVPVCSEARPAMRQAGPAHQARCVLVGTALEGVE